MTAVTAVLGPPWSAVMCTVLYLDPRGHDAREGDIPTVHLTADHRGLSAVPASCRAWKAWCSCLTRHSPWTTMPESCRSLTFSHPPPRESDADRRWLRKASAGECGLPRRPCRSTSVEGAQ